MKLVGDIDVYSVGVIDWTKFNGEVDMSGIKFIDSTGLGFINEYICSVTKLVGLQEQPLRVLRISGVLGKVNAYSYGAVS